MGAGRGSRCLRRAGLGGTRRRHAGVRRLVWLFERDLWAAETGARCFVPLYLATLIQRSALDCLGSGGPLAVRLFLLARTGTGLGDPHTQSEFAAAGTTAGELGSNACNSAGDWCLPVDGVSPVSTNHGDLQAFDAALGRRNGNDRVDHLRRPYPFQCAAGIRFSAGRVFAFPQLLPWARRSDADRSL